MVAPPLPARAGKARSAATRSGYDPLAKPVKVPLYALSRVARSGATRSDYTSGIPFITVGGVAVGGGGAAVPGSPRILHDTLTITDTLNEVPTTARMVQHFGLPHVGDAVQITIGSQNAVQADFTGTVLRCRSYYVDTPANPHFDLDCIDDTEGINARRIYARYVGQTVTSIATALVSAASVTGYTLRIDAAIGPIVIDQISFADRTLSDALTQLMKRAGSNWSMGPGKTIYIGPDGGTNPRLVNAVHPSLLDIDVSRDYSQVVTRVLSEGGGGQLLTQIPAGETMLALDTTVWYEPAGEVTIADQRLSYSSVDLGGAGSLVGPGAAPSGTPTLALAAGAGVPDGQHSYAVTFVTAAGESLPSPVNTITVGSVPAPGTAPTAGAPQGGSGPDVGVHQYGVSFVTSSGETPPGPTVSVTTTPIAPPTTAPTASGPSTGGSIDVGTHDYAVTFVTPQGETTPSPISGGVVTVAGSGQLSPPNAPTATAASGAGLSVGTYTYAATVVNTNGETTTGATVNVTTTGPMAPPVGDFSAALSGPGNLGDGAGGAYHWTTTFVTASGETTIGAGSNLGWGAGATQAVQLTNLPYSTNPAVVSVRLYRTVNRGAGASPSEFKLVTTIANNPSSPTRSYLDNVADAGLGASAPSTNTTPQSLQVQLTVDAVGGWQRRIYRSAVGGGALKLLTTLSGATTSYRDTTPDASLGGAPPSSNGTGTNQQTITLTAIPAPGYQRRLYRRSGGAGLRALVTLDTVTTTYTDTSPNSALGAAPPATNTAVACQVPLTIPTGGALVTARKIWGTAAGASQLKLIATVADNSTTAYLVTTPDASLGANAPTGNTATANQVLVTNLPIGGATVTGRKIYRTAANLTTPLKVLTTIADNTTTTIQDIQPDAALGANAPTGDTSGLQQPTGIVPQGSTSMPVASVGPFRTGGGWAVIGNGEQVIRYTGRTGGTLTGIPATGSGAIIATIAYNSTITAAPLLIGLPASGAGSLRFTVNRGDEVNLLVTENDVAAQQALAALIGGDGIQEDSISDNRLSAKEARARAQAWLKVRKDVEVSVRAVTRDRNTVTGRTLTVNLGVFQLYGVPFTIQAVNISTFTPNLQPHYALTASSVRFTFEDWQRMLKEGI